MTTTLRRILGSFLAIGCVLLLYAGASAGETSAPAASLETAPANTWVKLGEEATGFRYWPMFCFDPNLGKFVLNAGEPKSKAHADTEHFSLATLKWTNAYPDGSPYKAEAGPTDAPGVDFDGSGKDPAVKKDKNGFLRLLRALNPYVRDPGAFFQYAYASDDGKLYSYFHNLTLVFDPKTSTWSDLGVPAFPPKNQSICMYGSLAYDPVNKELLYTNGTCDCDGGSPGSWTFNIASKEWKKLSPGSAEMKELNADATALNKKLAAWINACRNRFYCTESEAEEKADLSAGCKELNGLTEKLLAKTAGAKLGALESNGVKAATEPLKQMNSALQSLTSKLTGKLSSETLVETAAILDLSDRARRALDTEPCGRAVSPMVTCNGLGKIVLFSGARFDSYLADTWVYDCKTRTWEQRFPKTSPAPRGGHVLSWLPKSKKVVLFGAIPFSSPYGIEHGNQPPPQDLWSYDVETNEWKLLALPQKDGPSGVYSCADGNDTLVGFSHDPRNDQRRITWGMKVDAQAADAGTTKQGVASGISVPVFDTPVAFDRVSKPDADGIAGMLKSMPSNQWTLMPAPPRKINPHPWGTCPYDTVRHQLLSFGGGHSSAHFNDMAHFSLRTGLWSVGYAEEFPYVNASFCAFFNQTFHNHPTVPTHVWNTAVFDEASGKAVYCIRNGTWIYDPATREWEYPPVYENGGGSKVCMAPTPRGPMYWGSYGSLSLFNVASRTWSKVNVKGKQQLWHADGDFGGLCYDSKRECMWASLGGGEMNQYDFKTETITPVPTPGIPVNLVIREIIYVPELDMVLSAGRVAGADGQIGNLAFDIENKKWVGLVMPCSDGQPRTNDKDYSQISLALKYDPKLHLLIFHSNSQEILVGRIDKATIKTFEPRLQKPEKK